MQDQARNVGLLQSRIYGKASQVSCLAILFVSAMACNQKTSFSSSTEGASPKAATTNSDELDACTLVTKAEAEAVLGGRVNEGTSGPLSMRGGSMCIYATPDSLSARNVTVRVESPNFDWNKFKEEKRIEGERMQPKRGYIRPVPGLGKEAYFARHSLHVLTERGAVLTISIFKDAADAAAGEERETSAESAEKALAQKALSRM